MNELAFANQLLDRLQFLIDNPIFITILAPAIAAWVALLTGRPFKHLPGIIGILATAGGLIAAVLLETQAFANPVTAKIVANSWSIQLLNYMGGNDWRMALTLRADALTATALIGISLLFLIAALQLFGLGEARNIRSHHWFFLLLASMGATGAVLAADLITLYISLEMITLACAALLLTPLTAKNVSAAKGMLMASIGVSIPMFFSIIWFLSRTGVVELKELWGKQIPIDLSATGLAIAVLLVTFALKTGVIPLHRWLTDAAGVAIEPVALILIAALTQLGAYSLIRVGFTTFEVGFDWRYAFGAIGAISAILAPIAVLRGEGRGRSYKKQLAYIAIGQMGFVLIALSTATPLGDTAAIFQLVNFATYFPLLFFAIGEVRSAAIRADRWQQVARTAPIAFLALIAGVSGIAGIPPMNGFAPYLLVYEALLANSSLAVNLLAAAAFIGSALTAAAAISMLVRALSNQKEDDEQVAPSTWWSKAPMVVLGILSVGFGLVPNAILLDLIRPIVAVARTMPTEAVPTHADTLFVIESFVIFFAAIAIGAATYLRQKGFLQARNFQYANQISALVSPIALLAPIYGVLDFVMEHDLLDALAAAGIILRTIANVALGIVYVLAVRLVPEPEEDWEQQEEEIPSAEPHVTPQKAAQ